MLLHLPVIHIHWQTCTVLVKLDQKDVVKLEVEQMVVASVIKDGVCSIWKVMKLKSFTFRSWEVVWDVVEKTSDPQVISEPIEDGLPTKPDWGEKGYSRKFAHLVQYYLWVSTLQSDVTGWGDIEKWEEGSSSVRLMGWMKMSPDFHGQFLLLFEMISRSVSYQYTRSTCKMCSSLEMKKRLNQSALGSWDWSLVSLRYPRWVLQGAR